MRIGARLVDSVRGRAVASAAVMLLTAAALPKAAEARKNVLLIFDEDKDLPGLAVINRSVEEVFETGLEGDVEFYSESLNLSQFQDALVDIIKDAKRAAETIRRLRALFRKEHAERAPVDVNALVEDVLGLLETDIDGKNIRVRLERGEDLPPVVGDSVQLRQVILNLLVNAEEAIALAADGVREIQIDIRRSESGRIAIDVRDSGVGVKDAELERMFEHFVSSKPHGLGMGLAISRSIVEAHDGRIWATRNDDRGLTLHVELPAAPGTRRDHGESWSNPSVAS
jgi:signal transduction histidine kinase